MNAGAHAGGGQGAVANPDRGEIRETPRGAGPRVAQAIVVVLAVGLMSGLGLVVYYRPLGVGFWAGTHPTRVGLHLEVVAILSAGHMIAAGAAVLLLALRGIRVRRVTPLALLAACLFAIGAAALVPWQAGYPWSDAWSEDEIKMVGAGSAPRVNFSARDVGFPERVTVRPSYQDVEATRFRRSRVALAVLHAAAVPVVLLIAARRRRRRAGLSVVDGG